MKTLIIMLTNEFYSPYIIDYKQFENFEIIFWDRLGIDKNSEFIRYYDGKNKIKRNYLDYLRYSKFIKTTILKGNYNKVVVFGFELIFFLKGFLLKNKIDYIIDIRDDHKLRKFMNVKKIINSASQVVLSSEKYKIWLPKSDKYLIAHNVRGFSHRNVNLDNNKLNKFKKVNNKMVISAIGGIRDSEINKLFINNLKNNSKFELRYHGIGPDSEELEKFSNLNEVSNVLFTGKYERKEEMSFYTNSDLINVLRYPDSLNNITALPNRLYLSVVFNKPLLAYKGTYLSDLIKKYNLGIVLNSFEKTSKTIEKYIVNFNSSEYLKGRKMFLEKVFEENQIYLSKIKEFMIGDNKV